ncbi:DUF1460 domain-containing protein [Sesbania bispinosa]|nr:DUF1460 domain-containing protein [Sesbania bispinosa]
MVSETVPHGCNEQIHDESEMLLAASQLCDVPITVAKELEPRIFIPSGVLLLHVSSLFLEKEPSEVAKMYGRLKWIREFTGG